VRSRHSQRDRRTSASRPGGKRRQAAELHRVVGRLQARQAEATAWWRVAPAELHGRAMIELSRYAERMARLTGLGKRSQERFPGFPRERAVARVGR